MDRYVSLDEISDGKLYDLNDMVKADCGDCEGCSACCRGMGNTIILDPLDVSRLTAELGSTFEEMLNDQIEIHMADGLILPSLKMSGPGESCSFLDREGRCSIHKARPGICRLFPLGRYFENNSFRYFLQIHECKKEYRSKIKVRKWIDTPDLKRNQIFISQWHYFLKEVQKFLENAGDDAMRRHAALYILKQFYAAGYEQQNDFYEQFEERLKTAREELLH